MRSLLFVALFGLVALSHAAPSTGVWDLFKTVHGKTYSSAAEEALRRQIFIEKVDQIEQHNERYEAGEESFSMAINRFSDMLTSEVKSMMNGLKPSDKSEAPATFVKLDSDKDIPDTVDWRKKGIVTPVKDQGQCGSCWAFSATGSFEGQHAKKSGKLISLSEQQLVDCSGKEGNQGCNGGLMDQAFTYIKSCGGLELEAKYPYHAEDRSCKFEKKHIAASLTGFVDVTSGDEEALKQAVATIGPISVAIDASHMSFQSYNSGVYNERQCSSTQLDHGVLAVGYGTENGKDYWLVKNSWADSWGEDGYIKMTRNKKNQCGIATQASYPTV